MGTKEWPEKKKKGKRSDEKKIFVCVGDGT